MQRSVLILGGSKFMGRATVDYFIKASWKVTTFNRGHVHWEACTQPEVNRIHGSREEETKFINFLRSTNWDVVVDFTSWDASDMSTITDCLQDKVNHYLFISSDSVYQVCPLSLDLPFEQATKPKKVIFWENIHWPVNGTWTPRSEETALPPFSPKLRQRLKEKDSYGYGKIRCEQKLQRAFQTSNFPYTALRLPDVVGPFDHTKRHWKYQLWVQCATKEAPIEFDCYGPTRPLSFVYSQDVVTAIAAIIDKGKPTFGQAYNFAFDEKPTLVEYVKEIGMAIGIPNFEIVVKEGKSSKAFFPSVNFGPVTNEKAKRELGWKPTPLGDALRDTCAWFHLAWAKFPNKRPLQHLEKGQIEYLHKIHQTEEDSKQKVREGKDTK